MMIRFPVFYCVLLAATALARQRGNVIQVYEGDTAEYRCQKPLAFATLHPGVEWYQNSTLIDRYMHQRLRYWRKKNRIFIYGVHSSDGGVWSIRPKDVYQNSGLSTWCNFTLQILADPEEEEEEQHQHQHDRRLNVNNHKPRNAVDSSTATAIQAPVFKKPDQMARARHQHKAAGATVSLKCPAEGSPKPAIDWTKDGKKIQRRLGSVLLHKYSLVLEAANGDDSGNYTCTVSNQYGSENFTYELVVKGLPHKPQLMGMSNVTVARGETARFDCQIVPQEPEPSVEWYRHVSVNGSYYDADGAPYAEQLEVEAATSPFILSIENATIEDNGRYVCAVRNSFGLSIQSAHLAVLELEEVPENDDDDDRKLIFLFSGILSASIIIALIGLTIWIFKCIKLKPQPICHKKVVVVQSTQADVLAPPIVKIEKHLKKSKSMSPISEYEFTLDDTFELARENLKLAQVIGEGAFGQVMKAEALINEQTTTVAVKMLKNNYSDDDVIGLVSEMEVMKLIGKHENIVNLLGCCTVNGPLYVILEYADNGNLRDFLRKRRLETLEGKEPAYLTLPEIVDYGRQVAIGMAFLSSKKCVHRDLAARNVLVHHDGTLKIADFGLARDVQDSEYYRTTSNGLLPVKWMAPESLFVRLYTSQSDVWSFGILLWEMASLAEPPYPDLDNIESLFRLIQEGYRMEQPPSCPIEVYLIMRNCWQYQPNDRPSFIQLVDQMNQLEENASSPN